MNYKLEHIALICEDLGKSVRYYENHFGRKAAPIRKAGDGQSFCFVSISRAAAIQLIESAVDTVINHHGFGTGDVEQVAKDLREKNTEIIRNIRDANNKLTTLFVKNCNGLKMAVTLPR